MMLKIILRDFRTYVLIVTLAVLTSAGCDQYEYSSPLPGTIQLSFRAKYTQFDTSFSLNNFTLRVTEVQAIRSDGAKANVFLDPKAIGRPPDVYNTLGRPAYDSAQVFGQYYLPPAQYVGLTLLIDPGAQVVLDGYRVIPVVRDPNAANIAFISMNYPFTIQELKTTQLIVTVDLDNSLQKQAYSFLYQPTFYISSSSIF